jgi:hypothetical protein
MNHAMGGGDTGGHNYGNAYEATIFGCKLARDKAVKTHKRSTHAVFREKTAEEVHKYCT